MEEAGEAVSVSLHRLSEQNVNHSEDAFHRTIEDYGLALDIPLRMANIPSFGRFPVLLLSDWLRFVLHFGFA